MATVVLISARTETTAAADWRKQTTFWRDLSNSEPDSTPSLSRSREGHQAASARAWTMATVLNMRGRHGVVPPGAVYIGHAAPRFRLARSKWANPFKIGRDGTREGVIARYRAWLLLWRPDLVAALPELRGKDLACWCAPLPCHGEVLLELANREDRGRRRWRKT